LDIRVTADIERHKKAFPCVLVQARKGAELTEAYFRVLLDDVKFNQLDHNNRLIYTVEIFGRESFNGIFTTGVELSLGKLYSDSTGHPILPHSSSLEPNSQ
jgi:hypothetical protein